MNKQFDHFLIDDIANGRINTIDDFLFKYCEFKKVENNKTYFSEQHLDINVGMIVYVPINRNKELTKFKFFITLINQLAEQGLIYFLEREPSQKRKFPVFIYNDKNELQIDESFIIIIREYFDKQIIPSPIMPEYIQREYLSEKEQFMREETRDRRKALRVTKWIGIASIIIASSAFIVTVLNYFLKPDVQRVEITSLKLLNENSNVLNSDSSSTENIDSSFSKYKVTVEKDKVK